MAWAQLSLIYATLTDEEATQELARTSRLLHDGSGMTYEQRQQMALAYCELLIETELRAVERLEL